MSISSFFISRLREPSTWRGFILLATALGVSISPELSEAIVALGLAFAGGVAVVTPDRLPEPMPTIAAADTTGHDNYSERRPGFDL